LVTILRNQNSIRDKINSKLNSENACYHAVQNLLPSGLLFKNIKIHRTIIFCKQSLSDTSLCAPISSYIYSIHRHAQHKQQCSRLLVSAYIQATIRHTHHLELTTNHTKGHILTREIDLIPLHKQH
jgi:hypothetical protein